MNPIIRRLVALIGGWLLCLGLATTPGGAAPSGPPVRVGGTLALTGPLAATSILHKLAGEIYIEQQNRGNGLSGRPVEWVLLDDQSKPDVARSLYERLITVEKVDLLMGPYGTAAILAALPVAQRYQKMLISTTLGIPHLAKYAMHIPVNSFGPDPDKTAPARLYDALASTSRPPKTIAIVTSKFPSAQFISTGARDVAGARSLNVVLYLEYEFGTRDFMPIATRLKESNPDFLWVGALGLDGNLLLDAFKKLDYTPRGHYYLFPAPGPLVATPEAKFALAPTHFEEHAPFTDNPVAAEFVKLFNERAGKAKVPYPRVELQAAGGYIGWQALGIAVEATKSLDDKVLVNWFKTHRVETIVGTMRFDGPNNYGEDLSKVKQIQDGRWVVVWPREWAAPGARLLLPGP